MNKWVRREVREHMEKNVAIRKARPPLLRRMINWLFVGRSFSDYLLIYIAINLVCVLIEFIAGRYFNDSIPVWSLTNQDDINLKAFILAVGGYLVTAQVGVLGVISIAIGLVSLIAQREDASTDVKLYYHQSLSVEVVSSCIALLLVVCIQLVWPAQFVLHRMGAGTHLQFFKVVLMCVHIGWLSVNLVALANFISTTFFFVQRVHRERIREQYTAYFVIPAQMTKRLREQLYHSAANSLASTSGTEAKHVQLSFGYDLGSPETVEVQRTFNTTVALHDVRMLWIGWVVRRWTKRCRSASLPQEAERGEDQKPLLSFCIFLDQAMTGTFAICKRRGGVPLTGIERWVLKRAFIFQRRVRDE
ncbi:hypothetical protein [Mesorhizobium marinum]|uniref:Uncharacterized protein n=1 Tax=Mesorhizobium marinum TaxID=3228790 RepID=A0ABV3QZE6_9HYPH